MEGANDLQFVIRCLESNTVPEVIQIRQVESVITLECRMESFVVSDNISHVERHVHIFNLYHNAL